MLRRWLAPVALAGMSVAAITQPDDKPPASVSRRHPIADFAQLPRIEDPQISPDGKAIALKIAIDGTQYFAINPIDGRQRQLVPIGDADLNWWRWVNDDWLVIGVGVITRFRGEDWYISRTFGVSAKDGKLVKLAPLAAQNADDVIWTAHDGSPRILLSYQTSIYGTDPGYWPRVDEFDVSTGKRRPLQDPVSGVMSWYADGGGVIRMGIGHDDDGRSTRVLYRPSADRNFRTIDRARNRDDSVIAPALFLPDGTHAMMIDDDDGGFSALYDLDLTTLTRGKQMFASEGYDIGGLVTDEPGYRLLGVRVNERSPAIRWLDPDLAALRRRRTNW